MSASQLIANRFEIGDLEMDLPGNLPQRDWLQRMNAEMDNLRAALNWGLQSGNAQTGLRLAVRLRWFWYTSLPWSEGRDWLQRLLAANPDPSLLRARALEILGQIVSNLGEYPLAQTLFEESLAL